MSNPFERTWDYAGEAEAAILEEAKTTIRAAVDQGLQRLAPSLSQLHKDALAQFWNDAAIELESLTNTVKANRAAFEPIWADLVAEAEHLAALKERIVAIRSQKGTPNVH